MDWEISRVIPLTKYWNMYKIQRSNMHNGVTMLSVSATAWWSQVVVCTMRSLIQTHKINSVCTYITTEQHHTVEPFHPLLGLSSITGCWQMALTGPLLSSLFYWDKAQWEKSRQEVNVHCRRTIYRPIYLLLMDGAIWERKGLTGVKRWMCCEFGICGAFWLNTNCIVVINRLVLDD